MEISSKKKSIVEISLNQGFTIIELMTVMVIISIVTAFSVINYRPGNQQVDLDMEANQFAQEVRKAQEWALAAHQIGAVSQPGYGVYFSLGGSYMVYTDTINNGYYNNGDNVQQTVNLDNNLEISACSLDSASVNSASVNFIPPDPITKISQAGVSANEVVVTFHLKNTSKIRRVTINRAGLVYVE